MFRNYFTSLHKSGSQMNIHTYKMQVEENNEFSFELYCIWQNLKKCYFILELLACRRFSLLHAGIFFHEQ